MRTHQSEIQNRKSKIARDCKPAVGVLAVNRMDTSDFISLPGGDLIRRGLEELAMGQESEAALLVLIGAPRLRRLGLPVPETKTGLPEHRLYGLLASSDADSAHSRYNALVRRLVRFERALECVT